MPPLKSTVAERKNLIAYLSRLGGNTAGPLTFDERETPRLRIIADGRVGLSRYVFSYEIKDA